MKLSKPGHSTVVAYLALFFAMSGTAVAATGGSFILGRSNVATTTTGLTNSNGTPLSLAARSGFSPLAVNSSVRVANLNGDLLDGFDSLSFQRKLTADCAAGKALFGISQTGTVKCTSLLAGPAGPAGPAGATGPAGPSASGTVIRSFSQAGSVTAPSTQVRSQSDEGTQSDSYIVATVPAFTLASAGFVDILGHAKHTVTDGSNQYCNGLEPADTRLEIIGAPDATRSIGSSSNTASSRETVWLPAGTYSARAVFTPAICWMEWDEMPPSEGETHISEVTVKVLSI